MSGSPGIGEKGAPEIGEKGAPEIGEKGAPEIGEKGAPEIGEKGAPSLKPRTDSVLPRRIRDRGSSRSPDQGSLCNGGSLIGDPYFIMSDRSSGIPM